jgi:hypothetical protein
MVVDVVPSQATNTVVMVEEIKSERALIVFSSNLSFVS